MAEKNSPTSASTGRKRKADQIALVSNRISSAKRLRRGWQERYKLEELYEKFLGEVAVFGSHEWDEDRFTVNRMWPTIKTLLPSLFLQNPSFVIRSKNESTDPNSILKAQMAQAMLKAIAEQEHHLEFSVKLALLQSFFSIGVLKNVYRPRLIKNPSAGQPMFENQNGVPILDENQLPKPIIDPETGEQAIEPKEILDDETYRWNWVNGDKMLLPDQGPDHLRWTWIGEEITVLLDEARNDERFPSNLRNQLRSNTGRISEERLGRSREGQFGRLSGFAGFPDEAEPDKWITYTEYWDIVERKHKIWVEGQSFSDTQFLVDEPYPEGIERHPYSLLLGFTPIIAPRPSPWPLPHTWNWLGMQREWAIRRRQGMVGAKRTARKFYYDDSTFPDPEFAVAALQSSEDMQGVKVSSVERLPIVQQDPPIPPNINEDLLLIERDWNLTTGIGARQGQRGRNTATETQIEQQAGESRDLDMRHAVNVWLETAGQKMFQLLQGTLTLGMYAKMRGTSDSLYLNWVARVYGGEFAQQISQFPNVRRSFNEQFGDDRWQFVTREEIDFEAEVSIAPGSARPRNMQNEKNDFFELMALLGGNPLLTQSRALLNQVAQMFEFFDISMIDEILAASQRAQQIEAVQAGRFQGQQSAPPVDPGGSSGGLF